MLPGRRPSLPPPPDMGDLSQEEWAQIQQVLQRQREEEEKNQAVYK